MIYLSNEWINRSNEKLKDNSKVLENSYSDINISRITEKSVELENSDRKGNYNKDEKKDINIPPKVYMMEKKNKSYVLIEVVKKTEYDQILKEYKKKLKKKKIKKMKKMKMKKEKMKKMKTKMKTLVLTEFLNLIKKVL